MIEPPALLMPSRQLQAVLAPYPLNLFMVEMLALYGQQFTNLAVFVPAKLLGQPDQLQAQGIIVLRRKATSGRPCKAPRLKYAEKISRCYQFTPAITGALARPGGTRKTVHLPKLKTKSVMAKS